MKGFNINTNTRGARRNTNKPSLVVLAPGQMVTAFQKKRYNPAEFPSKVFPRGKKEEPPKVDPPEIPDPPEEKEPEPEKITVHVHENVEYREPALIEPEEEEEYTEDEPVISEEPIAPEEEDVYSDVSVPPPEEDVSDLQAEEDASVPSPEEDVSDLQAEEAGYETNSTVPEEPVEVVSDVSDVHEEEEEDMDMMTLSKQLNCESIKPFRRLFRKMDEPERRLLGSMAKLQIVHKWHWVYQLWKLYNPEAPETPDALWLTLKEITELERSSADVLMAGVINRATKVFESSRSVNTGGISFNMKGAIIGPPGSGKSLLLRTIWLKIISYLVHNSCFKDVFMFPLDFGRVTIKTIEDWYRVISEVTVEALLIHRLDLQLFADSLRKAFAAALQRKPLRHLPKPASFQDYLRRPMKEVDQLLWRINQCYNDPSLVDAFVTNVAVLPQTIAHIFGMDRTFMLLDHIDSIDIDITVGTRKIQLLEFAKMGLLQSQYLISATDGLSLMDRLGSLDDESVNIATSTTMIPIYGTTEGQFNQTLVIHFDDNPAQPVLKLTPAHCGGCPGYVAQFDEICFSLVDISETTSKRKAQRKLIELCEVVEAFLGTILNFEDGVPNVASVEFEAEKKKRVKKSG